MENNTSSGSTLSDLDKKNLAVLGGALIQIRSAARCSDFSPQQALDEIYEISDRLHNVPSMIRTTQACDAEALLKDGVCEHWPTGLNSATFDRLAEFMRLVQRPEFEKF